jgi:hypothetical protein
MPRERLVGTGRFELPTPRTPSECSTRLSHVPTGKDSTDATVARATVSLQRRGSLIKFTLQLILRASTFEGDALLQISPIRSHAHIHLQRHGQGMDFLHLLPHQRLHKLNFVFGNFEHQFVVNL